MITDIDLPGAGGRRHSTTNDPLGSARGAEVLFCSHYVDHILYYFLRRLACTVRLQILCSQPNDWTERLAGDGQRLTILRPRSRFDGRYKAALERMYAERPWSLAHCFHGNDELANLIRWAGSRVPVIAYRAYIGHLKFRENPSVYWHVRHPGLAAVVAVSRAVKEYLESFRFLRPRNVHAIGHGIDREWVASQSAPRHGLRQRLGIGPDPLLVAGMAKLRPYKRFDLFVEAAERLAHRPVHFVHVGEDQGWREKVPALGNLHFLGHVSDPWPLLSEADVFASTAHNEAFGRSNLEAMACGKPVVGSNTGGLLDLVEHDVNGRLFRSGDAGSFADEVLFYDQNRDALTRHAAHARERARTRFSSHAMTRRYLDLYAQVLHDRASPA